MTMIFDGDSDKGDSDNAKKIRASLYKVNRKMRRMKRKIE